MGGDMTRPERGMCSGRLNDFKKQECGTTGQKKKNQHREIEAICADLILLRLER